MSKKMQPFTVVTAGVVPTGETTSVSLFAIVCASVASTRSTLRKAERSRRTAVALTAERAADAPALTGRLIAELVIQRPFAVAVAR